MSVCHSDIADDSLFWSLVSPVLFLIIETITDFIKLSDKYNHVI